jgi:predicted RNase H-like nuclease
MTLVAGIDGCKGGWIAVCADLETGIAHPVFVETLLALFERPFAPELAAIDMPMGFANEAEPGGRACERAARAILGPAGRASCVFSAPCRPALAETAYPTASARNRAAHGVGLSKQSFNLFPKMREADKFKRTKATIRLHESHPEICFARLAGAPVRAPKKTSEGQRTRIDLLAKVGFADMSSWIERFPRKRVAPDDVIDAAVVCLTAVRIAKGVATSIPSPPERDSFGIEMAIWR